MSKQALEILQQINPPKVNVVYNDYCMAYNVIRACSYFIPGVNECKLFDEYLLTDFLHDPLRCQQCKELTKLLEELK